MGSLEKIKPNTGSLEAWLKKFKGPYVISDKLDGISAQIHNDKGEYKMYTRGEGDDEGNIGEDISYLLKHINVGELKNLPKDASIRGELIIKRKNFEKIKVKYNGKYKNIRNTVTGIKNSKTVDGELIELANFVDFVAYNVIHPNMNQTNQMEQLEEWDINIVEYKVVKKLDEKTLEDYLKDRRKNSPYDVDGIVCFDSSKEHKLIPGNPEYGFAFKMVLDDQFTIATIKRIIWEPTMDSYLKPVVEINPVDLVGTTVTFATAHNAKMVYDNKLGKGARIKIIRSGDVIPYIMEVVEKAKKPDMPDIPYVWNETEVDILIDYDEEIDEEILDKVKVKLLTHFFKKLDV
jgi:DNA ligase (NAD+)